MKKFLQGFYYAFNGVGYTFRTQINFKVECFTALAVTASGFYLGLSSSEWLWVTAAMCIVLITELANTAIETLVDLVSPDYNPKAGIVKDISSAVVLMAAVFAAVTGLIIFLPKLLHAS